MPRIVDHEAQRATILDGCFDLFARKGYGAATMRGMARELGVSTGTLYHYFPSKDDLFRRMFERNARRDVVQAEAIITDGDDLKSRLRKLEGYLEERRHYLQRVLLVAMDYLRTADDPASRAFVAETARTYRRTLGERLGLPGETLGGAAFSLVLGAIVHGLLDPAAPPIAEQLEVVASLF